MQKCCHAAIKEWITSIIVMLLPSVKLPQPEVARKTACAMLAEWPGLCLRHAEGICIAPFTSAKDKSLNSESHTSLHDNCGTQQHG